MVIIRAAIMFSNGETVEGHDYGYALSLANKLGFSGEKVHGFVTSSDSFVLPDEAAEIAFNNKQITEKVKELTPEMLWPNFGVD